MTTTESTPPPLSENHQRRFWDKVSVAPSGCWLWTASTYREGYGKFSVWEAGKTKTRPAHRVAWELAEGPIPPDKVLLHTCDVRECVNPGHLKVGSQGENVRDMYSKGRGPAHAPNGSGLTLQKASEIRAKYIPGEMGYRRLAREYGVSTTLIRQVVVGHVWRSES